jgi:hypothetical protein
VTTYDIDLELDITDFIPYPRTYIHNDMADRDAEDCHPIGAVTGLQSALDDKLDDSQVDTSEITDSASRIPASSVVKARLDGKVDKVSGKGLSQNDFTNTLKSKLDGISAGAEVNVNADWTADSGDAQILNKPTLGTASSKNVGTSAGQIPILNASGKLVDSVIPSISIMTFMGEVGSKGALTTLSSAQSGDYALVNGSTASENGMWILSGIYSELSDWKQVVTSADVISVNNKTGIVTLGKSDVGLGNVDNTSDANKPVSTATQTALNAKLDDSQLVTSWASTPSDASIASEKLVKTGLDGKVDKVSGKGLSTNDFTTALKNKLDGIATGAEVNVQANWSESDSSSDAYIQNKPDLSAKADFAVATITGDGTTEDFVVTHSLGTLPHVTIYDSNGIEVDAVIAVTTTTATVSFYPAPANAVAFSVVVTE